VGYPEFPFSQDIWFDTQPLFVFAPSPTGNPIAL